MLHGGLFSSISSMTRLLGASVVLSLSGLGSLLLGCGEGDLPVALEEPRVAEGCGDGRRGGDELCDGDVVACSALGAAWGTNATARCRPDCRGYDVSTCPIAEGSRAEVVKPRERDARWEGARCNDGGSFGFQVSLSPTRSKRWLLHLEGGGWCDDVSVSCRLRAQCRLPPGDPLLHGVPQRDRAIVDVASSGVFSRSARLNPGLADANHVFAYYCSSDFWSGTQTTPVPTTASTGPGSFGPWIFAGHANVAAVVEALEQRYGLDDADPETLFVLTGTSAGGVGVVANVEHVASLLPATASRGQLRAVIDAGTPPGLEGIGPTLGWDEPECGQTSSGLADELVFTRAMAPSLWRGDPGPECVRRNADAPGRCYLGYVADDVWRERGLPYLVAQSQRDPVWFSTYGLAVPASHDAPEWQPLEARMRERFTGMPWVFSGRDVAIEGIGDYHTIITYDLGLAYCERGALPGTCAGPRFGEHLREFLAAPRDAADRRVIFGAGNPVLP